MPLLVDNVIVEDKIESVTAFLDQFPRIKNVSEKLIKEKIRVIGPGRLLYVGQREIGATIPEDGVIQYLGSEDATTCHIGVLRHTGSGATCIGHFDGCDTKGGIDLMISRVGKLSKEKSMGRLELHLVGGFDDDKHSSHDISIALLSILQSLEVAIHLMTACITEANTEERNHIPFPILYGLCVNVQTGEIFKASFPDKGPDLPLRSARHFTGGKEMIDIYDDTSNQLVLQPFSYTALDHIEKWVTVPNHIIREHLSTSPAQEPADFEDNVRASLRQMLEHPHPLLTVFHDNRPRRYKKHVSGAWNPV